MPDAFGLMAIATALYVWLGMLTDFGVNASIVRSKESDKPEFLATAFSIQVGRGAIIAALLAIVSVCLSLAQEYEFVKPGTVYSDPRLPLFLFGICLSVGMTSFQSIKHAIAQRQMNLRPLVVLEVSGQLVALAVMIFASRLDTGAFTLIIGMLAANLTVVIGSYLFLPGPRSAFGFKREHFDEIFHYGKWLLIASFFGFLANKGNQVLFGYLFDKTAFSFFAIATIWVTAAETVIAKILQSVAYPAFSEILRKKPENLTQTYASFRLAADLSCFAIFAGIYICSGYFFSIIYSPEYAPVADYVKLLSVYILFLPYRLLNTAILASGDSRRFTIIAIAPSVALFSLTPLIFNRFGAEAAIVFSASIPIFALPFTWKFSEKIVRFSWLREMPMIILSVLGACLLIATH